MDGEKISSHANVVASMFENLSKCLTDNAALLRQLHARGQSGALPGPSAVEDKPPTKRKREEKPKSKRTLSAYQLWMAVERESLKTSPTQFAPKEVMGELARRWKLVSQADKVPFEDEAARLKQESGDKAENGKPKLLKRSLTAYQIFMAEEREKLKISHSEMKSPQELMGEIGRRWKLLDSTVKTQYAEKAEKLKQERQAAMDAVSAAPSQPPEVIESADAEEQKKKKKKKKKKDKQPEA